MGRATLMYDADCGFCRWTIGKVLAWDRRRALRLLPIQTAQGDSLLGGVEEAARLESWHLSTSDGRVYSGGDVFAPLLRLLPGGRPLATAVALAPSTVRRVYAWVAAHRSAFGRPLRRSWIDRADRRIKLRQAGIP